MLDMFTWALVGILLSLVGRFTSRRPVGTGLGLAVSGRPSRPLIPLKPPDPDLSVDLLSRLLSGPRRVSVWLGLCASLQNRLMLSLWGMLLARGSFGSARPGR
jgi:hypothetical protein